MEIHDRTALLPSQLAHLSRAGTVTAPRPDPTLVEPPEPSQIAPLQEYLNQTSNDIRRLNGLEGIKPLPPPPQPEDKRARILEQINQSPQAKANWQRLSPQEQAQFMSLAEAMWRTGFGPMNGGGNGETGGLGGTGAGNRGTGGPGGISGGLGNLGGFGAGTGCGIFPIPMSGTDPNLIRLLETGSLSNRDTEGNTLLGNLVRLKDQKFAKGLDPGDILRQTVAAVANPDTINQGDRGSCAIASIEYLHAKNQPADYVRVIAGLTSEEGKVRLRNGDTLDREDGSTGRDNSGRSDINRIYQDSMREYANGPRDYDNATDQHYITFMDRDGRVIRIPVGSGTPMEEYERAMDAVLPYDSEWAPKTEGSEAELRRLLGEGHPVQVVLSWGNGTHALVLEGLDAGQAYLRNPWGDRDVGQSGTNYPQRNAGPGGHIAIAKNEFMSRLVTYSRPTTAPQPNGQPRKLPEFLRNFKVGG